MSTSTNTGRSLQDILNSQETTHSSKYTNRRTYQNNVRDNRRGSGRGNGRGNGRGKARGSNHYSEKVVQNVSSEKTSLTFDNAQFPELVNHALANNSDTDVSLNTLDFKKVINKEEIKPFGSYQTVFPGWTIINPKTKKVTTYDKYGYILEKVNPASQCQITSEQIYSIYEKMSTRWCEYYDSTNELLGDRSPYINYKNEIAELVEEDQRIFHLMYDDHDNDYLSSDEDFNINDD